MKKSIIASLLIACSLFIGGNTDARAEYPYDKPINIIVPFGPGGGVDIAARILADYFQQNYNITINVVNKPGGAHPRRLLPAELQHHHQRREQARRRTGHRHQ